MPAALPVRNLEAEAQGLGEIVAQLLAGALVLALMLVLAIATIVIGTGMKTVLGGGGYQNLKFFVNDNSGVYESSTLATVAIGLIPMIWWLVRHGTIFRPHWTVTAFAVALTFACLLVPIGTEARTGLLCIAALAVLLLRRLLLVEP